MDFWSPVAIEVEEGSGKALLRREAVGEDLGEDRKCSSAPARCMFYHATNPGRMAHERVRGRFVSGHSNKRRST